MGARGVGGCCRRCPTHRRSPTSLAGRVPTCRSPPSPARVPEQLGKLLPTPQRPGSAEEPKIKQAGSTLQQGSLTEDQGVRAA